MQCPRCNTNIYGNVDKCRVCGFVFNTPKSTIKETEKPHNGLLDPKDFENYTKNLELYKNKNKSTNYAIPIIFILVIVVIVVFVALSKFLLS